MKPIRLLLFLTLIFTAAPVCAEEQSSDTLPDDYLPFALYQRDSGFVGTCEFLEGFTLSIDIPRQVTGKGLDVPTLLSFIRDHNVIGTLEYPDGRVTPVAYEIVRHRKTDEIYMKSSLGYFLWEHLTVHDTSMSFAIYWWYTSPVRLVDLQTLQMAEALLADSASWHRADDRKCEDDIASNRWSLFCALKYAAIEKMGEYNHHNTATQTVRFVIDELVPNHGYAHTLMDYNNDPATTHADILHVLELARQRIEKELAEVGE